MDTNDRRKVEDDYSLCPQLMEMEIDLTLPSSPVSSRSKSTTPPSNTMTRSMSRQAKRDVIVRDREDCKDGKPGNQQHRARYLHGT